MIKCAAINYRSDFTPTKAEKGILEAGGLVPFNRAVFAFPKTDGKILEANVLPFLGAGTRTGARQLGRVRAPFPAG